MLYMKRQFLLHRLMDDIPPGDTPPPAQGGAVTPPPAEAPPKGDPPPADTPPPADFDPADVWVKVKTKWAGGDAKKEAMAGRYANFEAVLDAQAAIRERISKGEIKTALPKDATEEQVKTWRQENGIPETADKYELKPADGKISEADKAIIGKYLLPKAHATNMTAAQATAGLEAFREFVADQTVRIGAQDAADQEAATNKLTAEWGKDYGTHMNHIKGLLSTLPASVAKNFEQGRLADGTAIMNNPDFVKALRVWAADINPTGTIVPNAGGDHASAIDDRLSAIRNVMKTDRKAYNKDAKMQQEFRDLITAQQKVKGKK